MMIYQRLGPGTPLRHLFKLSRIEKHGFHFTRQSLINDGHLPTLYAMVLDHLA